MPTYDYRCETCGGEFEFVQSFSEDALKKCPGKRKGGPVTEQCTAPGKGKVLKVFSKVGIAFKGDGFYKNDHGSMASAKPESSPSSTDSDSSSDSSTTKSDTKSDSKSDTSSTTKSDTKKKADTKASPSKD
ncbi:MAG: FmdB family zinc ribbon protein [Acidimicrobiales bacterium]